MRLLPYIYTLAWEAHTRGLPLMRPLALDYPDDPNVWELGSQYLLGPDLLVAPVTRAGATHWPVYLPAGGWYDFWTGERYEGGQSVSVATPLETVPLFARGGSIIPLGPVMQRTDERPLDDLTLLVYPGASGRLLALRRRRGHAGVPSRSARADRGAELVRRWGGASRGRRRDRRSTPGSRPHVT